MENKISVPDTLPGAAPIKCCNCISNTFPPDADILPPSDDREIKTKIFTTNHTNQHEQKEFFFKQECYDINSCIFAVNRKLGSGFLEAVYQEALEIELKRKGIPFAAQKEIKIHYDGIMLSNKYIADIICYDKIILELKSVKKINNQHKAQLLNYLTATGFKLGLLVNFNSFPKAEIVRMVR